MHARHQEFVDTAKKHIDDVDEDIVAGLIKHLGIAIGNKDAELVSCSDKSELDRVRDSFMKKKLGLSSTSDADLESSIAEVCEKMGKSNPNKSRITFYYLLAVKYGRTSMFT